LNKKFVHIQQGKFYYNTTEISPTTVVKLPGEHNLWNAAAAISAVWEMINGDVAAIANGLSNFHGLPHRLKFVREVGGVKYYDDSIATTPGSAIAAIKSFDGPKILIVGGHDKGADYRPLGEAIERSNVRAVFAIGANRNKVQAQVGEKTSTQIHLLDNQNLAEIVKIVNQSTEPGDIVIMSPATSSFDMFKDYKDRGEQFIAAVKNLPLPEKLR
jgi:UDP-N-acetylmuramoylalanine--D-glutamate ligase